MSKSISSASLNKQLQKLLNKNSLKPLSLLNFCIIIRNPLAKILAHTSSIGQNTQRLVEHVRETSVEMINNKYHLCGFHKYAKGGH